MAKEPKDEKSTLPAKSAPEKAGKAAKKAAPKKAAAGPAEPAAKKAPAKKTGEKPAAKKAAEKEPAARPAAKKAAAKPKAAETAPQDPAGGPRITVVTRPVPKKKVLPLRTDRPSLLAKPAPKPEPEPAPAPAPEPGEPPTPKEVAEVDGHHVFRFARPLSRVPHAAAPAKPAAAPAAPPKPAAPAKAVAPPKPAPPPPEEVEEESAEVFQGEASDAASAEADAPEAAPAAEEPGEAGEGEAPEAEETAASDAPEESSEAAAAKPARPNIVSLPQPPRQVVPSGPRAPRMHYGPGVKTPPPGSAPVYVAPVKLERKPPRVYDRTPSAAAMAAAARDAANRDPRAPMPSAPGGQRQMPQRPSYNEPSADNRRKTKRERRMEKLQARQDRSTRIEQELADAREMAVTGEAVFIREGITVKELAEKLNQKVRDVIAKLMMQKILVTINQPLDSEVAIQVANLFGYAAETISFEDEISLTQESAPDSEKEMRAPVVTVMGHVDHGKSSLLEAIHNVDITGKEFGGITQHIGAYKVRNKGKDYVFLDTPGHEAFTLMRARGARVTDVVILVVAADDGVMPQTIEAINHCKAANVPMIVAINKMDKPGADPDRVKRELSQQGVLTEDWGGDVVWCPVSAKKREGIEQLLEMVTLVTDILNLRAAPTSPCSGTVLESRLDRARGAVATVLVQDGTIKVGDYFLCGATYGRVRGLYDDRGEKLEAAGPSTPTEILGFSEVPAVGAVFQGMEDEAKARQVAAYRKEQDKQRSLRQGRVTLDTVFGQIQQGEIQELALILKADVQGSLEAVAKQLNDLATSEIKVRIVHAGVGAVSESDVLLAAASKAVVVGFNVRPDRKAAELAKSESVDITLHTVIYDLVDQLKQALTGMLKPIERENILGHAEVREIFKVTGVGTIAGCLVADGRVTRVAKVRLLRDNVIVHTGKISSLKRFKDDASEVKEGTECGIGLENYNDVKPGDVIEAFETFQEARTL